VQKYFPVLDSSVYSQCVNDIRQNVAVGCSGGGLICQHCNATTVNLFVQSAFCSVPFEIKSAKSNITNFTKLEKEGDTVIFGLSSVCADRIIYTKLSCRLTFVNGLVEQCIL